MKQNPYKIGKVDDARRERLLQLDELCRSKSRESLKIRWPSAQEQQRASLDDFGSEGPATRLIGLGDQLADYSKLIQNGASVISHDKFENLCVPIVDRALTAAWGDSGDLNNTPLSVADAKPKRLSSYIVISNQLRVQNPLLAGSFIEAQLLSSIATALDDAVLNGSGTNDEPLGILADTSLPTHSRASAGVNAEADLLAMEKAISDSHGEHDPEDFVWLLASDTRESLRKLGGTSDPVFRPGGGAGPLGYKSAVMPTAPNGTAILTQASQLAIFDWSSLEIETIPDVDQLTEGFKTMLVSGFFDVAVLDQNAVVVAQDPA